MNIKEIFEKSENGTISYEEFEKLAKDGGAKFTDLSEGKYVSKSKYDSDLKSKADEMDVLNGQITDLNTTIATRDSDLADLQAKLDAAGEDATKLADLSTSLTNLQTKYEKDIENYQNKMAQQSYEFAVKEFANAQNFTSQAAKRDFVHSMIAKNLQMEDGKILGREDFVEKYSQENADAFVVTQSEPPAPEPKDPLPTFAASTPGATPENKDTFDFNFTGVRAHK